MTSDGENLVERTFDKMITLSDNYWREWKGALSLETCYDFRNLFDLLVDFVTVDGALDAMDFGDDEEAYYDVMDNEWSDAYRKLDDRLRIL